MDGGKDLERIALIDVCSEDDLLISSPVGWRRPPGHKQHCESPSEKPENISLQLERAPSPSDSPEIKRNASCKYNLRKSLAWDSAFFTSEGVLDPEELAVVNTTYRKAQLPVLPEITEDARKSAESSTTFDSDNWIAENTEIDLFENLRVSIQNFHAKYGKSPSSTNSSGAVKSRKTDATITGSKLDSTSCSASENASVPSQVKIKPVFAPNKQSWSGRLLEKSNNRIAGLQQVTKAASGNGEQKLSLRPPKVAPRFQTTPSSGDSVPRSIHIKPNGTGNIPPLVASKKHTRRVQFNDDSRPTPSTTSFGTAKSRSTVSCSPNRAVASSGAPVDRPPLHSVRKNVSSTSSGQQRSSKPVSAHPVRTSRDISRRKNTNIVLRPSNISPTSSVDSFASVSSSSSTSTARKPTTSDTPPVSNVPHGPSGDKSLKPSGLKLPSPKIGYFDADNSSIRTACRSSGRQPRVTSKNPCEAKTNIGPAAQRKAAGRASTLSASSDSHCSDIAFPSATGSSVKSCSNTPEDARNSRFQSEESSNNFQNFALELGDNDGRATPVGRRCLTLSEQGGEREEQLQSLTRRTSVAANERTLSGEGKQGIKEDAALETKIHDHEKENMMPSAVELSVT